MAAIEQTMYEVIYRIVKPRWDDGNIPAQVAQLASRQGKTRNAIDLGCGTGTHSIYLAQQGFAVVGIDTSLTAIQKAQAKASKAGVKPEFIVHDVTQLDFLNGPFDIRVGCGLSAWTEHCGTSALCFGINPANGTRRHFADLGRRTLDGVRLSPR